MYRELKVISDYINFEDGSIIIKSIKHNINVRIEHKGSFKYLKKIKNDLFSNKFFKLAFEGNTLVDNDSAKRFLSKVEKANEFYLINVATKPRHKPDPTLKENKPILKIDKEEYIKFLTSIQKQSVALITISEDNKNKISDSILFQVKTNSNDILFIWESAREVSKATYIFISNDINYAEILKRIQSYLEATNIENKRRIIKENAFVQNWLCFVDIVKHTEIDIYISCINDMISNVNFNSQYFNPEIKIDDKHDASNIVTYTVFLDSFLYYKNKFYLVDNLVDPKLNFDKEITFREFKLADNTIIYTTVVCLYNIFESKNQILYYEEQETKLEIPYEYNAKYGGYNSNLHRRPYSLDSKYIGFHFFELGKEGVIKRSMTIEKSTLLNLIS